MHHPREVGTESPENELSLSVEPLHRLSDESVDNVLRIYIATPCAVVAKVRADDSPALDVGSEKESCGFYLGQLGHGKGVP
jgi:hypothetical protein